MKKYLILALVSLLSFSQVAMAAFTDVSEDHPFATSIEWLQDNGVVVGYSDGAYRPYQEVNRAEFLKMLYETIGMEGHDVDLPFPDVPEDEWYTKYVKEAYATGVVVGYPDGYFRPENSINLAEAVKIVMNGFYDVDALYGDGTEYNYCQNFTGSHNPSVDTSAWYWKYIHVADEKCIISTSTSAFGEGGLKPAYNINRGDMADLLFKAKAVKDNHVDSYIYPMEPDSIIETYETMGEYVDLVLNPSTNESYVANEPSGFDRIGFGGEGFINVAPDGVSASVYVLAESGWDVGELDDIQTFYFEVEEPSPCWMEPECDEPSIVNYYGPFHGKLKLLVQ